jgi:hypothetical protein
MQYYGVKLLPGAMVSDHCAAFRNAFYNYFPEGVFGQSYPHIKRKYGEGEYTSKKWIHFHEAKLWLLCCTGHHNYITLSKHLLHEQ